MQKIILSNLLFNAEYFYQVWHHLKPEYFDDGARRVYTLMQDHFDSYKTIPTVNALGIALDKKSVGQIEQEQIKEFLKTVKNEPEDMSWLIKETELHCKDKAVYHALSKSIEIQDNAFKPEEERDKRLPDLGAIEGIMRDAISVSFDNNVGHDWYDDYTQRFLLYQTKANKIPFLLDILNRITKGGVERGTLNITVAGTNVGKSLGMCSLAAEYMQQGYNVLYITMEMAEHVVAKRIDANILDVTLDELDEGLISFPDYKARMERANKNSGKALGKLKIKQYPTGGASVNHFNALMQDLKLKQGFTPDVVMVDYLGICASSRMKVYSENSYTMVKAIAEELRGFAVEHNVVLWTGAQTGRAANVASDVDVSDIAESFGIAHTADFMLACIETEELAEMGVQLFKQIKSRYGDKNFINKFQLGVKKGNQRWYSVQQPNDLPSIPATNTVNKAVGEMNKQKDQNFTTKREKLDKLASEITF